MSKKYLFRTCCNCSGDGPAISEFIRYMDEIEKASGKKPVMIGVSHYPMFGVVRGIKYILEDKGE